MDWPDAYDSHDETRQWEVKYYEQHNKEMLMKSKKTLFAMTLICGGITMGSVAQARDIIQMAGSSTVLPFASIVAEEFGYAYPSYKTPVVGSGGTGGGLRQFCQGVGLNTTDIANASRKISPKEIEACSSQDVQSILEIPFGYDGVVFASSKGQTEFELTAADLYKASAAKVSIDGKPTDNPYTQWSQINSNLPQQDILLVVPASNHGTREVFEEKLLIPGCEATETNQTLAQDKKSVTCTTLRSDGHVIEVAGDYTETLTRLNVQPEAIGVFGLGFYEQNRDRLQVATIDGIEPSLETIASGTYPVSRSLYFYVKGEHLDIIPGLTEYVEFFLNPDVSGMGGPLAEIGLIPLGENERKVILENFRTQAASRQ